MIILYNVHIKFIFFIIAYKLYKTFLRYGSCMTRRPPSKDYKAHFYFYLYNLQIIHTDSALTVFQASSVQYSP